MNKMANIELPSTVSTGRWTDEEHQMFLEGLHTYGKNWIHVAKAVGTRNSLQVRSHAQKYYRAEEAQKKRIKRSGNYYLSQRDLEQFSFMVDKSTQYGEGVTFCDRDFEGLSLFEENF